MISIPLPLTPGRSGFGPSLALEYASSAGNSVFGVGWSLSGVSIIGLSSKRLPKYDGDDHFVFNGSEELVPKLTKQGDDWEPCISEQPDYWIHHFRRIVDKDHTRFEKWVHRETGRVHWRTRGPDNSVSIFGHHFSGDTRIHDPEDPSRTYQWLMEARYDDSGNAIFYEYLPENTENIDIGHSDETQRLIDGRGFSQRYLKCITYGNTRPLSSHTPIPDENRWLFHIVFDYGDHDDDPHPFHEASQPWAARSDPFSTYRPGFEVRTCRLCRRVMMFHQFTQLGLNPAPVGEIKFAYHEHPAGTTLEQIEYTGYRTDMETGEITKRAIPPLSFTYAHPRMGHHFHPIPEIASRNMPQGLSGMQYRWIDLYGEGLPGILTETGHAWYYKPNLGQGLFDDQTLVAKKPSHLVGTYALSDFDSDGNPNLVVLAGRQAGYCEYDRDNDQWLGYRPFPAAPVLDNLGTKAQWIDLNGDGRSDVIISRQDRFTWYPSEGKEGFGAPVEFANAGIDSANQVQTIEEDLGLNCQFADMTGDGLLDQVHIQNGRVAYWPQLGNGRFGDAIIMGNAPVFDFDAQFDPVRLRLADLDGSGTADLLYIGRGEICYWINAGGNRFVDGGKIKGLPYIDNLSSAQVLDFLGDGTPCLVWSSPLTCQSHNPIQYLRLTDGVQPRLLLSVDNAMGKTVHLTYSTSGRHYLRDRNAKRPWVTKLPNHFPVVDRMEIIDQIGNTRFSTRYAYHDGFFDSKERAFRGFGQVDQYDSETVEPSSDVAEDEFTAPACIRTFFHNGALGWGEHRAGYYYNDDSEHALLHEPVFQVQLDFYGKTFEDGIRTLSGQMLRQEIFSTSRDGQRAEHPYRVTQSTYRIRQLQPSRDEDNACFDVYPSETLVHEYEQSPEDPRIVHDLTLSVDDYGNAIQACTIAYPRRSAIVGTLEDQQRHYISATSSQFLNIDAVARLEIGIPIEKRKFEVTIPAAETGDLLSYDTVRSAVANALAAPLDVHEVLDPEATAPQARLIQWQRFLYWNAEATTALPHGNAGPKTLLHHQETACFNNDLVGIVFEDRVPPLMLRTQGRYLFQDNYWWQKSPTLHYLPPESFYYLDHVTRLNGGATQYRPDPYFLTLQEIEDDVGNGIRADIDYNLIAPWQIVDPNENLAEVQYDPLGMIVVSTTCGSVAGPSGSTEPYGHERLSGYTMQPDADADAILAEADRFIQNAGQFFCYDLKAWQRERSPIFSLSIVREQWVHDGSGRPRGDSPFQITLTYIDGFGRTLQSKQRVEAGLSISRDDAGHIVCDDLGQPLEADTPERWLVSGHRVYNNKQLPVRQYEPFFSSLIRFEADEELQTFGVTTLSRYDALGRVQQTELPNGTVIKSDITPWEDRSFDPNDTVHESAYGVIRELLPAEDTERQAYDRSLAHADTPLIVRRDPPGRDIEQVETSHDHPDRVTRTRLDIQGNVTEVIDPRGLSAFSYQHDMLGRVLHDHSMDAGDKWMLSDAMDQPLHLWDGCGVHQQMSYDTIGRPTAIHVEGNGLDHRVERIVYGDQSTVTDAVNRNARGRLVEYYDQAGLITALQYAPDGNPLHMQRQLIQLSGNYSAEPDWRELGSDALDRPYETRSAYDALGRPTRQTLPDRTLRVFSYLPSGNVNQVRVSTADGSLTEVPFLRRCAYNARGQRTLAVLGNGIEITYAYERDTFRLKRFTAAHPGNGGRTYQDIHYTYDPVGNITRHVDRAQEPESGSIPLLHGLRIPTRSNYTYDAFYQLRSATGRVHQALLQHDYRPGLAYPKIKNTQHLTSGNPSAVERYTRTYSYDPSGNINTITHRGDTRNWTTEIRTSPTSNRSLPARDHNGIDIPDPEAHYDSNGNCTYMPHLRRLDWNYRNNIATAVIVERPENEGGDDAEYYVYGGDGMRIRKIHSRIDNGIREVVEKIYLDGCEIKRIHRDDTRILERTTSHISDGINRIALLHQWTLDRLARETDDITRKKTHYQLSNHLGSSNLEINEHGDVITYEEYFPFGDTAFIAGSEREVRLKDYRYSGKERDDATGFYYYGYRYYAAWIGNWLSPDPIGPEDSLNLYQFVWNNSINMSDPNGLCGTCGCQEEPLSWESELLLDEIREGASEHGIDIPEGQEGCYDFSYEYIYESGCEQTHVSVQVALEIGPEGVTAEVQGSVETTPLPEGSLIGETARGPIEVGAEITAAPAPQPMARPRTRPVRIETPPEPGEAPTDVSPAPPESEGNPEEIPQTDADPPESEEDIRPGETSGELRLQTGAPDDAQIAENLIASEAYARYASSIAGADSPSEVYDPFASLVMGFPMGPVRFPPPVEEIPYEEARERNERWLNEPIIGNAGMHPRRTYGDYEIQQSLEEHGPIYENPGASLSYAYSQAVNPNNPALNQASMNLGYIGFNVLPGPRAGAPIVTIRRRVSSGRTSRFRSAGSRPAARTGREGGPGGISSLRFRSDPRQIEFDFSGGSGPPAPPRHGRGGDGQPPMPRRRASRRRRALRQEHPDRFWSEVHPAREPSQRQRVILLRQPRRMTSAHPEYDSFMQSAAAMHHALRRAGSRPNFHTIEVIRHYNERGEICDLVVASARHRHAESLAHRGPQSLMAQHGIRPDQVISVWISNSPCSRCLPVVQRGVPGAPIFYFLRYGGNAEPHNAPVRHPYNPETMPNPILLPVRR